MTETVNKLTSGQDSPEHAEIGQLSHSWLELCHQAKKLQIQREEDLQRSNEYHECIGAVESLFEQVSKEWDSLARYVSTTIRRCLLHFCSMFYYLWIMCLAQN